MASYLIYLPGLNSIPVDERLRAVGLECLTGDNVPTVETRELLPDVPGGGPDGGHGLLVRLFDAQQRDSAPPHRYDRSKQDWQAAKPDPQRNLAAGRYYLGRVAGEPVRPEDLQRPKGYTSLPVTLLDGQDWYMPVARRLPHDLGLDDEGRWGRRVKSSMRDYWQQSEQLFAQSLALEPFALEPAMRLIERGLSMNYLVNRDVLDWLGLVDEPKLFDLVAATFEREQIQQVRAEAARLLALDQKKTAGEAAADCSTSESATPASSSP